ncbi:hypothetical protein [Actinopolymorpha alba]|uniref:hypothetical protein n=1 Tax=Actinopolymorpha alba TaxID=533267 RepID=UPI00035E237E|nr:hypothetical protein [Actinopolymorpha alba]
MNQHGGIAQTLPRRTMLAAAGAALLGGVGTGALVAARPSQAAGYTLVWDNWGPLAGYGVNAECNPGGGSFPCDGSDVAIQHLSGYTAVTANPRGRITFVNAIGNRRFTDRTPDQQPLRLTSYEYVFAVRLPLVPSRDTAPWFPEQIHQMIQFWDGSERLWDSNKRTMEAAAFWKLNPWDPNFGKIFIYSRDASDNLIAVDTGFMPRLDTNWHIFDLHADLASQTYAGLLIDGLRVPNVQGRPLAWISHPDWGSDVTLILTAESENAYPGSQNPIVTQWTTQFRDPKLYRFD